QSYREFLLEFADFQLAYDGLRPVNPPARDEVGLPFLLEPAEKCPLSGFTPPCPEAISAADVGTMSVNYRNEPVAMRVRDPGTNKQAAGLAGDLSHVYRSNVLRADGRFNVQPNFYPPLTADVQPGDPFTPLFELTKTIRSRSAFWSARMKKVTTSASMASSGSLNLPIRIP